MIHLTRLRGPRTPHDRAVVDWVRSVAHQLGYDAADDDLLYAWQTFCLRNGAAFHQQYDAEVVHKALYDHLQPEETVYDTLSFDELSLLIQAVERQGEAMVEAVKRRVRGAA